MTVKHHALVTGAYGVVGLNVLEELVKRPEWSVIATGRKAQPPIASVNYVPADLSNSEGTRNALAAAGADKVTHLFFGAFKYAADAYEEIRVNVEILANTLEALKALGAPLQRVVNYQGSKAYGAILGPMRTPAKETDPRVPGPLFYFDQEDMLYERGAKDGFATTILRPDFVQGVGFGSYANLVNAVAVYGTVCKALNLPMYFPGGPAGFNALIQLTDARLLGRGSIWAALEPHSNNALYNITNGDLFRWSNIWPRIADYFKVDAGHPMHIDLARFMLDKGPLWTALQKKHGLVVGFDQLLDWNHVPIRGERGYEVHSSTIRIRKAGFHDCLDSDDRMIELFDDMRAKKYIP